MQYEKFHHPHCVFPAVTGLIASGRFSFNQEAVRQYDLALFRYCVLWICQDEGRIAFEFIKKPEIGCVRVHTGKYSTNIAASAFAKHYGINLHVIKCRKISERNGRLEIDFTGAVMEPLTRKTHDKTNHRVETGEEIV